MYDYQGMVIGACNQVWWTWEVEDVFRKVKRGDKMTMKNYAEKLHSQIDALVVQVGVCVCVYVCVCVSRYRRSGNFCVKNILCVNFSWR